MLPQNSSLGHVISSLALQIHHLVGLQISHLPCTLFQQNFQCYGREDVVGEKEGAS